MILLFGFYVRPYSILLFPLLVMHYHFKKGFNWSQVKKTILLSLILLVGYLPWPVRNYVSYQKIIPLVSLTAGYTAFGEDYNTFRRWVFAWNNYPEEINRFTDAVVHNESIEIPDEAIVPGYSKEDLQKSFEKCGDCGPSFLAHRGATTETPCAEDVREDFTGYLATYKKEKYLTYLFKAPLLNLKKYFFKHSVADQSGNMKSMVALVLLVSRSIIVTIGLLLGLYYVRKPLVFSLLIYITFMIWFICFYLRQLEMRYLLHADIILLLFFILGLFHFRSRKRPLTK
jgi:hypothetical protein